MNKTTLYNYINLCKKSNINLILNVANDINIINSPEKIAEKYLISVNEVVAVKEIIKYNNTFSNDPLTYVYNKYNKYKQNKKKYNEVDNNIQNNEQFGGDNNNNQINCPCCDCAKDGYIFTDEENQKCGQ
jgi:hypothetical protein